MQKYRYFALVTVISLILDQLSKIYIDSSFVIGESHQVISNFFHITYVRNPGAAFGMLSDSAIRIPFFLSISVIAVIAILWYVLKVAAEKQWQLVALGLILSGALGNFIDRARLGEVIDFLDVHWYNYHWPAFNVADSAICVGVAIMLICTWHEERQTKNT